MAKREFLQLCHKYEFTKYTIGGWYWSEKLDGERCFWDGGISRGQFKNTIPWANIAKDERYVDDQVATGLWSRYGNVIHAPDWFLDSLPKMPLDGELYSHTQGMNRQQIHSAIKKIVPVDSEWKKIVYEVFDSPAYETVFSSGLIDNVNFHKQFVDCIGWVNTHRGDDVFSTKPESVYESVYNVMKQRIQTGYNASCFVHVQYVLPYPQDRAIAVIKHQLGVIEEVGGEGLVIRNPHKSYECCRSHNILKVKSFDDAEGTVIGYVTGRETDKGSRLLGLMGALVLRLENGDIMELSGFTDEERILCDYKDEYTHERPTARDWAIRNPEALLPDYYESPNFPRGSRVTFKYRGINSSGIPNEARYWRKA